MIVYGLERRTVGSDGVKIVSREVIKPIVPPKGGDTEGAEEGLVSNSAFMRDDIRRMFPQADETAIGQTPPEEGNYGNVTFRVFAKGKCLAEYAVIEGEAFAVNPVLAELLEKLGIGQAYSPEDFTR